MKSLFTCIIAMIIYTFSIQAQEVESKQHQIYLELTPYILQGIQVENQGDIQVKSSPMISGNLGLNYSIQLDSKSRLNLGTGLTSTPFKYHYNFRMQHDSLSDSHHSLKASDFGMPMAYLKVSASRSFRIFDKHSAFSLGVQRSYYPIDALGVSTSASTLTITGNQMDFFTSRLEYIEEAYISGFIKWELYNMFDMFTFGIVANYMPKPIANGNYQFLNTDENNRGTLSHHFNYIGFETQIKLGQIGKVIQWY